MRGPRARGDERLDALRGHPPRRLRPGRAARGDGPRRRRRRGALPDAAALARRSSPTPTPSYHHALVRAYNDWLSEYVAHAPERFGGLAMLPNRGVDGARRRDRPRRRPARHPRRRDGLLPERHARRPTPEDDKVLGALAGARRAAQHPRVAHAGDAGRAPVALPGLRPLLRRAEPHRRADLRGRVRPLPRAADRRRRGRLRLGALRQGADRQQLPAARRRAARSRSSGCRASTSSSTSTSGS